MVPVIGGSSVERYRRAHSGAQAIGQERGVAFIVEGSVRRPAQRICVSATVVRTADSRQMWPDEIDVALDEVVLELRNA